MCGALHLFLGGLRVQLEQNIVYSNELASSGNDSSFFILMGFSAFTISLFGAITNKAIFKTYFVSMFSFYAMLFLANMDVSVLGSIKLGDHILLVAIVLAHTLGV